jgi:diguanylate cyclase (GGDEF)-like protein
MSRPIHVLFVAHDRALLRRGALMLQQFGIDVTTCASTSRVAQTIVSSDIDLVIADEQTLGRELAQIARWKESRQRHLPVFLLRSTSVIPFDDAVAAGIDDFLRHPLSPAEVLTRVRVASRSAEFESRFDAQSWDDALTGGASRQAMLDRLASTLKSKTSGREVGLLAMELDFFGSWQARHGALAANKVLRDVAALIEQLGPPGHLACRWETHQFVVLFTGQTLDAAKGVAEDLRQGVQDLKLTVDESLTASVGIALGAANDTADALVERVFQALDDAKGSGRDCVATHGQYSEERRKWSQQVNGGNPFAACVARDVMTPFVVELSSSDTLAYAETLLAQTQLELLPIVDARGRCSGIVQRDAVREALAVAAKAKLPVQPFATTDIEQIADATPFAKVIEHFAEGDHSLLVVHSKEGRARGFIERSHFLSLVKPLDADHFAAESYSPTTDYLVVPDLVLESV